MREFILSSNQQSLTAAILVYYVTPSRVIESDAIQVSSVLLSPLFEHTGSHPGLLSDIESAIRARRGHGCGRQSIGSQRALSPVRVPTPDSGVTSLLMSARGSWSLDNSASAGRLYGWA
jgi:hypothetical protein